jgi:hypothetical protein
VECAVVDAGRGVRAALVDNPKYANLTSDVRAVELALRPGVSSSTVQGRGGGLPAICRAIASEDGTLVFRSGKGQVTYTATPEETQERSARLDQLMPGTQVIVMITNKRA